MNKPVVMAAILFLVSLAAGAGARVALAPSPPEAASAASENEAGKGTHSEAALTPPGAGETATPVSSHLPSAQGAEGGTTASPEESGAGSGDVPSLHPGASAGRSSAAMPQAGGTAAAGNAANDRDQVEFRELSNILSQVSTVDAARFLIHLDDQQVIGILRPMSVQRAAVILARFPSERAKPLREHLLDLPEEMR